MSNFLRNPSQPTPLQQTIEKITDGTQNNEDWALIMSICDYAGAREERFVFSLLFNRSPFSSLFQCQRNDENHSKAFASPPEQSQLANDDIDIDGRQISSRLLD